MLKKICEIGIIMGFCALLCGCKILDASDKKIEDMEFEVVDEQVLPEEICEITWSICSTISPGCLFN